jgi:hypothetical protein
MSGGGAGNGVPPKDRCAWAGADPLYVAYHDEEWASRSTMTAGCSRCSSWKERRRV